MAPRGFSLHDGRHRVVEFELERVEDLDRPPRLDAEDAADDARRRATLLRFDARVVVGYVDYHQGMELEGQA